MDLLMVSLDGGLRPDVRDRRIENASILRISTNVFILSGE